MPHIKQIVTTVRLVYSDGAVMTMEADPARVANGATDAAIVAQLRQQATNIQQKFGSLGGSEAIHRRGKQKVRTARDRKSKLDAKAQILKHPAVLRPPTDEPAPPQS